MQFIVKKNDNRYLSEDGRNCTTPKRAMEFRSVEHARDFINSPSLGIAVYLSPADYTNQVWQQWTIHELTATYQVGEAL